MILLDNIRSMKSVIYRVDEAGTKAGLKLNSNKTKVMHIKGKNSTDNAIIKVNTIYLKNIKNVKYIS